jgi:hypothetical protein
LDTSRGNYIDAGLSLHALAHVDVLVARATRQNMLGLEIALQALGQRKTPAALRRILVAHGFAPRREDKDSPTDEEVDFRQQVYDLFGKWIYSPEGGEARDADDAPHFPWPIFQHSDLERVSTLDAAPPEILKGTDFNRLCSRL